ncbi:DNA replication/repair protein RecF [Gallaecimonas xiamenensis]|uniref:DNA replication and repair protein RecF n=1 Tax=Gallaecimonas xiamenensis 3-C-1 TaxID=745411 RepID=K2IZK1_9GAMM|nr:DNA replication/repair protein RecF [Gallaecimonas xiamenensis]EKE75991.1 DNA replication and repair protein RecF [Gallaecimonas xiamenensis 3-C-1]
MSVSRFALERFRNIDSLQLEPGPGFNCIVGPNGSGKTAILEGLHFLGLGRSFRTHQAARAIQDGQGDFLLFARKEEGDRAHQLGMQRDRAGNLSLRLDGENPDRLAAFAEVLPLQLITPESFDLLTGGPANRRQFIDWGVFHVESAFLGCWSRVKRLLKQRNALLKRRPKRYDELSYWDGEFARYSGQLTALRQAYVAELLPALAPMLERLLPQYQVSLEFAQGWDKSLPLDGVLQQQFERDQALGFTQAGPHKADLRIKVDGIPVQEFFSRGELKLLVCALKLAQAALLKDKRQRQVSFLIDDLPAELDGDKRLALTTALADTQAQVFVTAIDADKVDDMVAPLSDVRLFHVKQGRLGGADG